MNDKRKKIIGALFIAAGIAIAGFAMFHFFGDERTYTAKIKVETEETEENTQEEEIIPFELKNISDEILEMLQIDEQELAEIIQEWTLCNGEYKSAVGVEFYEMDESMNTPEKCSVLMKTLVGEGHMEEERRMLRIDYYKELKEYNIHP